MKKKPDHSLSKTEPTSLVRKVFKPLGTKAQLPAGETRQETSEFERLKKVWLDENLHRFRDDYQESLREKMQAIQPGDSFYTDSNVNYRSALIVDGITSKTSRIQDKSKRGKKAITHKTYYFLVRQWSWSLNTWTELPNKSKGYEFLYDVQEFVQSIELPRLSKSPDQLWREAEKALENNDVEKYALDKAQTQDQGPDAQLMHVGSKEALLAVQQDLEAKRSHAVSIQSTMEMIIAQKLQALEAVKDKMNAMLVVFERQIKKIMRVITTIELYLGIKEEIVQIQEGPTASADEPICIRQGLMFLDEEVGDVWDDGQGLEWNKKGIAAFDNWLTRNQNYKKVLPEKKGIAAFQARRDHKKRANHGNPFANLEKLEADMQTFLLIRNGDNLYRLITDKINFRPRLFPKRDELQRLFEYWTLADTFEQKEQNPEAWVRHEKLSDKEKERFGEWTKYRDHDSANKIKEFSEDSVFFYKMRLTLFQGLIDRTAILHPLNENTEYKLFSASAQEAGLVRLIYDDELTLPSGRKPFWDWLSGINETISFGSRIVLSHNWGFLNSVGTHREMEEYDFKESDQLHKERLDDRYKSKTSGKWSNTPPRPAEGLYFVQKGERWQNEPVWIDNPYFDETLLVTPDVEKYSPDHNRRYWPKDRKSYKNNTQSSGDKYYHFELNPDIRMTHAQQKAYYGKVVEKSIALDIESDGYKGEYLHGVVRNPRKIHKHTMVPVKTWEDEEPAGEMEPKFEYHDVKHEFLCIRYNPKDKIGQFNMYRSWDVEPTERKVNISWKIDPSDAFIINYDALTVEDIDFYLTSRVDRRHYIHMMPLLMEVRKTILKEEKAEVDFRKLISGEVYKQSGTHPAEAQIKAAIENWKRNLKWKRAIAHDDSKALRMIVKVLVNELTR